MCSWIVGTLLSWWDYLIYGILDVMDIVGSNVQESTLKKSLGFQSVFLNGYWNWLELKKSKNQWFNIKNLLQNGVRVKFSEKFLQFCLPRDSASICLAIIDLFRLRAINFSKFSNFFFQKSKQWKFRAKITL